MGDGLVIGMVGLPHKDELVLRALVRLLDGGVSTRLELSEQLADCHLVFGAAGVPRPALSSVCAWVSVLPAATPATPPVHSDAHAFADAAPALQTDASGQWTVTAPLRMTNVLAAVQCVARAHAQRARPAPHRSPPACWLALYQLLSTRVHAGERRRAVVPLNAGQEIVVDFVQGRIHSAVPVQALLDGLSHVGEPRRVSQIEEEVMRALAPIPLAHLVWGLALRLSAAPLPAPALAGRFRLTRWPDAVALASAGYPRLAALLTRRPMDCGEAASASGLALPAVQWFLETCVVLGVAERVDSEAAPAAPHLPPAASAPTAGAVPGWFGQLRERLKLW